MKKLKIRLDLDTLDVQTFRPSEGDEEIRGTVQGQATEFGDQTCRAPGTCVCNTIEDTCGSTCGPIESCQLFC